MGQIKFCKVPRKNLQNPEGPQKTYAVSQSRGVIDIAKLAKHMASHNSLFSQGTIMGILTDEVACIRELLCDGWIVKLGDLGTFNVNLKSNGVMESVPDEQTGKKPVFTAKDITGVNVTYKAGDGFEEMISDCEFVEVESSTYQQEHLNEKKKAIADGTWEPNPKTEGEGDDEEDVETHE